MDLVRNKHFQAYIESLYIKCSARYKAIPENEARAKFKDEFYEDVNMLNIIINSTFPQTKRVGDEYHFITRDDFVHTEIELKETYYPGAMTLRINANCEPEVQFENKRFKHGQITAEHKVKCWGGFHQFGQSFCDIGLSGALMDMYNFARVSNHDTVLLEA